MDDLAVNLSEGLSSDRQLREIGSTAAPKPKLLIVSSYRRSCGIAQYVEFLELALRKNEEFDLEIAALPVDLFRASGPYAHRASKQIFDSILMKAREADVVSIQLELGLFGLSPFEIWRRIGALVRVSKSVILTYHTVPVAGEARFKLSAAGLGERLRLSRANYVFNRLFGYVRRHPRKFRHLVHTLREAKNFELWGVDPNTVVAEPLSFLEKDVRTKLRSSTASRELLNQRYEVGECTLIGCFGFLAEYKGIETAVKSLAHLPARYHLLIVGGLHPEGIVRHSTEQPYIARLMAQIESDDIDRASERIHFCGALNNDDFNVAMAGCDAVVLPYAEVGQTSSGPAALALDLQKPLYCSRTHCFRELDRFEPDVLTFFEIGNYLELAQKLRHAEAESPAKAMARDRYGQKHNVEGRAQIYIDAANELLGRS